MQLSEKQLEMMEAEGHLLVIGGPGSGKTTASILKAAQLAARDLRPGQRVLFLSFARATVSRVIEAIGYEQRVPREQKRRIDVETYHSFCWRVLKTHGYLIGLPRRLQLLTPSMEAIALSAVRSQCASSPKKKAAEKAELLRLAKEEGRVCFDLFAPCVGDILGRSTRIRELLATAYPVIIIDEFQDTNAEQWCVVRELGRMSTLIVLGDPEQRIYDFAGADPERLNHFRAEFAPTELDLGAHNHRSVGTDIVAFGNDILTGRFRQDGYAGMHIIRYRSPTYSELVTATYGALKRLIGARTEGWSLAVLVPTKKMTREVSEVFRSPPAGMAEVAHTAVIDMEAAILAAEVVALLMQPNTGEQHLEQFIALVCNYFKGKGGDTPTATALREAAAIEKAYAEYIARRAAGAPPRKNSILVAMSAAYQRVQELSPTGDPNEDWTAIRNVLGGCDCKRLQEIAKEVRNVRLLARGMPLRQTLAQDWRENGSYRNTLAIIRQAFVQEHFATNAKPESGVVVMNMHKAKGKQFDEVIIFDGWPLVANGKRVAHSRRIVRSNDPEHISDQTRQNLRVAVTRGKRRTTILTPASDPCVLLAGLP